MKNINITIAQPYGNPEDKNPRQVSITLPDGVLLSANKGDADYVQHTYIYSKDGASKYGALALISQRQNIVNPNVDFEAFWSQATAAGVSGYTVNLLNYFQKLLKTTDKGGLWNDGRIATVERLQAFLDSDTQDFEYRLIQVLNDSQEMGLIKDVWQNTVLASAPEFMKGVQLNYYRQSDTDSYNAAIASCEDGNRVYNPYPSTNQTIFWDYIWVQDQNSAEAVDAIVDKWREESVKEQCEAYKDHIKYNPDAAESCLSDLKSQRETCVQDLAEVNEQIADLEKSISSAQKELADTQEALAEASDELAQNKELLAECEANPECTVETKNKLEKQIEENVEQIEAATATIEALTKQINELNIQLSATQQKAAVLAVDCAQLETQIQQHITAVNALYCCEPVFRFDQIQCGLKGCDDAPSKIIFKENPLSAGNAIFKANGIVAEGGEEFECCYRFSEIVYDCSEEPSELFEFQIEEEFPDNDDPCNGDTGIPACSGNA